MTDIIKLCSYSGDTYVVELPPVNCITDIIFSQISGDEIIAIYNHHKMLLWYDTGFGTRTEDYDEYSKQFKIVSYDDYKTFMDWFYNERTNKGH